MVGISQRWLRSEAAWRLSGWTYPSAVLATVGRLITPSDYLHRAADQMAPLRTWIPPEGSVLEIGSGLGGNLLAVGPGARRGVGVDVNPHYLRIARGLAARQGLPQLAFVRFDGVHWPLRPGTFDFAYSLGVFERLSPNVVEGLVRSTARALRPAGVGALYFLSDRARGTTFTRLLGDESYVTWARASVETLLAQSGLSLLEVVPWGTARQGKAGDDVAVADVYIVRPNSTL